MKQLYIRILIGLITIIPAACQENQDVLIMNSEKLFSTDEIKELNAIVKNFDAALMNSDPRVSLAETYIAYAKEIYSSMNQGRQLEYEPEIEAVFQDAIKTDVADEIWWLDSSSEKSSSVNINYNGKYLRYLQNVGDSYPFIDTYAQGLLTYQDLGAPHILSGFAKNSKNFDFSDKNIRLIFAIHYLTFYNL